MIFTVSNTSFSPSHYAAYILSCGTSGICCRNFSVILTIIYITINPYRRVSPNSPCMTGNTAGIIYSGNLAIINAVFYLSQCFTGNTACTLSGLNSCIGCTVINRTVGITYYTSDKIIAGNR